MFRFCLFNVLCLLSVSFLFAAAEPAQREWKTPDGKVLAQGEFVSLMDGEVCLMLPDGTGKTIPMKDLCAEDRKFAGNNGEDLDKIEETLPEAEQIGAKKPVTPKANPDIDITDNDVIAEASSGGIPQKIQDESGKYIGQKRVVMFDFESLWDKDRASGYGSIMGNMFWLKLNREKEFIIPESMADVRNVCEMQNIHPNPDTPLPQMKEWVTKTFNADIGIWGKIERVDADVMEIYDFWLKAVDFSVEPPRVIYEVNRARTEAVAEVTGIYVKAAIDKLYDRKARTAKEKAELDANWEKNPNLIVNGGFEKHHGEVPDGWESRCGQQRDPLGNLVKRVADESKQGNDYMHFTAPAAVAEGFGLMWYSKPFPIEEGAMYRIEYRFRKSAGNKMIVFVKCYDTIDTAFRPTADVLQEGFTDKPGQQTREVYRNQHSHVDEEPNVWHAHSEEFTPRHSRFSPKFGRVMMFVYWAAGTVDYDDFVLKKVKEASQEELRAKVKRHSLESKVSLKEMEENERRGTDTSKEIKKERQQGPDEKKLKTKIK
jgi:hypothetical protein